MALDTFAAMMAEILSQEKNTSSYHLSTDIRISCDYCGGEGLIEFDNEPDYDDHDE
jgi:hypothetical protein